jgi:hypothetical protein
VDRVICQQFDDIGWNYISMKILLDGDEGESPPKWQKILPGDGTKTLTDYPNPHLRYKGKGITGVDYHSWKGKEMSTYLRENPSFKQASNIRVR